MKKVGVQTEIGRRRYLWQGKSVINRKNVRQKATFDASTEIMFQITEILLRKPTAPQRKKKNILS
jgi:hypothetical protein